MSEGLPASGIVPVIMAGGSGTRLWPVSRDTMPKQFIALMPGGESTFQATMRRVTGTDFARPIVITSNDFRFICAEQLAEIGIAADIVLEPERRDSGPAIAVGALLAENRHADAVCLALAADHLIGDAEAFQADCRRIALLAGQGRIMTLGVRPTEPSTEYGYIAAGEDALGPDAFALERFVEKPDRDLAQDYIAKGYVWNSGNFAFAARTMIEELTRLAPQMLDAARAAVTAAKRDLDFIRLDPTAFALAPRISIDYAVMEKTTHAGVLFASFDWSDIGSWGSLHAVSERNGDDNVLEGDVSVLNTTNSFVRAEGTMAAVVGLSNVVVVATHDAVLVADKSRSAAVKDLVSQLKAQKRPQASEHLRIHRPWGWYQRIDIGPRFQVKHITVHPGATLSLQRHHHRAEHWVVVHGTAEVTIDGSVKLFHENEAAYLPIGCTHRMHNPGRIDLKIIEVQVGSYTGEDDIVRIEDVYARK